MPNNYPSTSPQTRDEYNLDGESTQATDSTYAPPHTPYAEGSTIYETFDYPAASYLKHQTVGGQGFSDGWDGPSGKSFRMTGTNKGLFYGQGSDEVHLGSGRSTDIGLLDYGTRHLWFESDVENNRTFTNPISSTSFYCTMLIRAYDTAAYDPDTNPNPGTGAAERVQFRVQFTDGVNGTGNVRLNVGVDQGDLFVSGSTAGYSEGTVLADSLVDAKTYLLAMKRTATHAYASLIEADGKSSTLKSEPTWSISHSTATGVDFESIELFGNNTDPSSYRGLRVDEIRIADNWLDSVKGLV